MELFLWLLALLIPYNTGFAFLWKPLLIHHGHPQRWKRLVILIPPLAILVVAAFIIKDFLKNLRSYLLDYLSD